MKITTFCGEITVVFYTPSGLTEHDDQIEVKIALWVVVNERTMRIHSTYIWTLEGLGNANPIHLVYIVQ